MAEMKIFGPPGTGKTTTLSRQIRRAAERYGSDAVVVGSFTRAAARELVSRDLPLDEGQVGTLHALCYRQLERCFTTLDVVAAFLAVDKHLTQEDGK
jgi:superfamily I DNA/RNA helicase